MSRISATDPKFLGTLESWLRERPEITVLFRYSHAGGAKDYFFFSSFLALLEHIRRSSPLTSIVAFRQPQLPLRGVVDDAFIARCLSEVSDGAEFPIREMQPRVYGKYMGFYFAERETHAKLREELEDLRGAPVA